MWLRKWYFSMGNVNVCLKTSVVDYVESESFKSRVENPRIMFEKQKTISLFALPQAMLNLSITERYRFNIDTIWINT